MGRLSLEAFTEMADMDTALHWHLTCNHFPAIIGGEGFAKLAIEACLEGDYGRFIDDGHRRGYARDVVEQWHLEHWLQDEVEA